MRIAVVGGGPGGLYFAYLWKRRHPAIRSICSSRTPPARPGALAWCSPNRRSSSCARMIRRRSTHRARHGELENITLNLRGERSRSTASASPRSGGSKLLQRPAGRRRRRRRDLPLRRRCGARRTRRLRPDRRGRRRQLAGAPHLRGRLRHLAVLRDQKFAWYGTAKRFETLSQTFVGPNSAHSTRTTTAIAPDMSTFLVECDRATWQRSALPTRVESRRRSAKRCSPTRSAATS